MFTIDADFVFDCVFDDALMTLRFVPATFTRATAKDWADYLTELPRPRIAGWEHMTGEERDSALFPFFSRHLDSLIESLYA